MLDFIYSIKDKRTGKVGYIGLTNDPNQRMLQHLQGNDIDESKNAWFRSIDPDMDILEIVKDDRKLAYSRERYWTLFYIDRGASLINVKNRIPEQSVYPNLSCYIRSQDAKYRCNLQFTRKPNFVQLANEYGLASCVVNYVTYYPESELEGFNQWVIASYPGLKRHSSQCEG